MASRHMMASDRIPFTPSVAQPTTLSLFDWGPPQPSPKASEQGREISRVEGRIAEAILAWVEYRTASGDLTFHAADLCQHVTQQHGGSPESAMRILRALRAAGQVQVSLISRSASQYRIEP
jgi:hypothetical protein